MAYKKGCGGLRDILLSVWGALYPVRNHYRKNWFTCVLYHQIDPSTFEKHIQYYSKHYTLCSLKELQDFYDNGIQLPRNPLFITFDDGWRSNYRLLPLIEEHEISVTIFLTTGLIGSNLYPPPINFYNEASIEEIEDAYPVKPERTMLTIEEIREMSKAVDFQAHGVHHHLSTILTPEKMREEILESKQAIEDITGKPVFAFAYPYNLANEREAEIVESCGFSLARVGDRVMNSFDTNRFLLNSIGINGDCSVDALNKKLLNAELKTILTT
jgi:peptidoglycan/xylan/chitin deacetylase (PgdA/CDA1 family)